MAPAIQIGSLGYDLVIDNDTGPTQLLAAARGPKRGREVNSMAHNLHTGRPPPLFADLSEPSLPLGPSGASPTEARV